MQEYALLSRGLRLKIFLHITLLGLTLPAPLYGQRTTASDSIRELEQLVVTASPIDKAIIPVQSLAGKALARLSVYSVADALRYFSGLQIKDYGGIGGLKTVNVRSLGSNHTGVFYDGIKLGNAQNGVIDLGRFSLDNMEAIQLYNGQKSNIFQTARDYASASALYLQARRPSFSDGQRRKLSLALKVGSFDTYNPSLLWEEKLSPSLSSQLSAEYMTTSGRYRFRYAKRDGYDTTQMRHNGDVRALRAEAGLYGRMSRGHWRTKLYLYNSERGYPGAVVREEPGKFRNQDRQWDTSLFAQGTMTYRATERYHLMFNAKLAYDYLHYLSDPRRDVSTMYVDNRYKQTEGYLSIAQLYSLSPLLSLSLANDLQYNYLSADLSDFAYPTRYSLLSAFAGHFTSGAWALQASLLHTIVHDRTRAVGAGAGSKSVLTPTIALSYKPAEGLALRAFYKRIFRMPTFNDLYYTSIGNSYLKPEYTTQYNLGASYTHEPRRGLLHRLELQTDIYYNQVRDKIVAIPTSNQFRWTMLNYGMAHIYGLELGIKAEWLLGKTQLSTHTTYTYTRAMDKTNPQSEFYRGQLPYIPWHSGSAILALQRGAWGINYSFIYTGKRYEDSANIPENYTKAWYTSDLSLSYQRPLGALRLRLTAEVNNLFNQQYEVVQNYPMPGTNFKFKLNINL